MHFQYHAMSASMVFLLTSTTFKLTPSPNIKPIITALTAVPMPCVTLPPVLGNDGTMQSLSHHIRPMDSAAFNIPMTCDTKSTYLALPIGGKVSTARSPLHRRQSTPSASTPCLDNVQIINVRSASLQPRITGDPLITVASFASNQARRTPLISATSASNVKYNEMMESRRRMLIFMAVLVLFSGMTIYTTVCTV